MVHNKLMTNSSFRRRFIAAILDIIIAFTPSIFLTLLVMISILDPNGAESTDGLFYAILTPFLVALLYNIGTHLFFQASFGKMIMGIKVVDAKGAKLSPWATIIRELFKIPSLVWLNGLMSMLSNKERRSWYDFKTGSAVVRVKRKSVK